MTIYICDQKYLSAVLITSSTSKKWVLWYPLLINIYGSVWTDRFSWPAIPLPRECRRMYRSFSAVVPSFLINFIIPSLCRSHFTAGHLWPLNSVFTVERNQIDEDTFSRFRFLIWFPMPIFLPRYRYWQKDRGALQWEPSRGKITRAYSSLVHYSHPNGRNLKVTTLSGYVTRIVWAFISKFLLQACRTTLDRQICFSSNE